MAKFNHFEFLKNRKFSIEPSPEDLKEFNLFMTQMALSMDSRYNNICDALNTEQFFKLPKNIQCLAFTSFDGVSFDMRWKKAKAGSTKTIKDQIFMVMSVFDLSYNEADSCIKFGTVDMKEVEELHAKLFDNKSINFRKQRTRKRK